MSNSYLLTDLTWPEVRDHLDRDQRLIVPIGACDQYGPHLPLGATTRIVESFAERLSDEFGVLRAPTLPYGVNARSDRRHSGTSTLRQKTLHAALNDLLASWEDHGFREFILLTVHDQDAHVEAIATVTGIRSRVRVVELLSIDLSSILTGDAGPEHGGEATTSLMLYLYPEAVRMDQAVDFIDPRTPASKYDRITRIPIGSAGSVGQPTLASRETGRRLYEYIYGKIRTHVFVDAS